MAVFVLALGAVHAYAQFSKELPPVEVTLDVGDTVLAVEGLAPPNAFITILENGSPIGTTTADGSGDFNKTFTAQTPGLHTVSVYAKVGSTTTDTVSKTVNLISQAETTLNFFLPTILQLSSTQVASGSVVTFSGMTIPGGKVTITLDNNYHASATTDSNGEWSYDLDTDGLYAGTHYVFAVVNDDLGNQSLSTSKRAFQVSSKESPVAPPEHIPSPEITEPRNNQHFSDPEIAVKGIALANSQIELWDGESLAGSSFASHLGQWQMSLLLSKPKHELKARVCVSGACSDFSADVTVFYDTIQPGSTLFLRMDDYRYSTRVDDPITLSIFYGRGGRPYELAIDWGDANSEHLTVEKGGHSEVKHVYDQPGQYNGVVTLRDVDGSVRSRYFSVMVAKPWKVPTLAIAFATPTTLIVLLLLIFRLRSLSTIVALVRKLILRI